MNDNAKYLQPLQKGETFSKPGKNSAGMSIVAWMDRFSTMEIREVEEAAESPLSTAAQVIAAKRVLAAIDDDDLPEARLSSAFVMDYTDGKPTQVTKVISVEDRSASQLVAELRRKLGLPEDVELRAVRSLEPADAEGDAPTPLIEPQTDADAGPDDTIETESDVF